MSEVTFAKSFLTQLDKKPIKLASDHVSDPRKYPNQSPFILPKITQPFPKRQRTVEPTRTVNATLKPMRGGGDAVTLSSVTLTTSIHDLKAQYAQQTGQQADKIKLLLNKKPAADLKTLKELGVDGDVELSVMLMGAGGVSGIPSAPTPPPVLPRAPPPPAEAGGAAAAATSAGDADKMEVDPQQAAAPESEKAQMEVDSQPQSGETARGILKTEEFWNDLKGFLAQRLRDENEAERLVDVFRKAVA